MTNKPSLGGLLHWATHRIPGVPAHVERPEGDQGTAHQGAGHQGAGNQDSAVHGRARRRGGAASRPSLNNRWNHSPARPARFMPAWQRRVAALFGREL